MIDNKIRDYVGLLKHLYGNRAYLQRLLSVSLTEDEHLYITRILEDDKSPNTIVSFKRGANPESALRAKYRLFEKLDSLILANTPSVSLPKRTELKREAFSNLTAGVLATSCGMHTIAKHKLKNALRAAKIPDLIDVRLAATELLIRIASNEGSFQEFKRLAAEYETLQETARTIKSINRLISSALLANNRATNRSRYLKKIADEALPILLSINLLKAPADIIIAGCPLATTVAQVIGDYGLANRWMNAYRTTCLQTETWDDSHQRDWLLQQIWLNEFFSRKRDMATFVERLMRLIEHGTTSWFVLSDTISGIALRSGDYPMARSLTTDALLHPCFRKQNKTHCRSLLIRAGYSALLANDEQLERTYRRRIKIYDLDKLHVHIIDAFSALNEQRTILFLEQCNKIIHNLPDVPTMTKNQKALRKQIHGAVRKIKLSERSTRVSHDDRLFTDLRQYFRENVIPLALQMV